MGPFISGKSSEMLRGLESFIVLLCSLYLWEKNIFCVIHVVKADISDTLLLYLYSSPPVLMLGEE